MRLVVAILLLCCSQSWAYRSPFSSNNKTVTGSAALAYWTFENNGASTTAERFSGELGALLNSPTVVSAKFGTGFRFTNSTTCSIRVTNVLKNASVGSVSCWIKFYEFHLNGGFLSCNQSGQDMQGLEMFTDVNGSVSVYMMYTAWGNRRQMGLSRKLELNKWCWVVITYDGTVFTAYIDGVSATGTTSTAGTPPTTWGNQTWFYIGTGANYNDKQYVGNCVIDEVVFWKEILTANKVKTIYNSIGGNDK